MNSKDRRHSGRVSPPIYDYDNQVYFKEYWDEWVDYRDGYRDLYKDRTRKSPVLFNNKNVNTKIDKILLRRKKMKTLRKQS